MDIFRRKSIDELVDVTSANRLRGSLSALHLVLLGVGAIVGTGIYTLVGIGAERAGPAVILSFAIAGLICACAALAYAELATMIPASGSSYTYSYAAIGEPVAWIVGWALILEYTVVCSAVAVGWSGYAVGFLESFGLGLPRALTSGPDAGGIVNLPAVMIVIAVGGMLLLGTRESARVNSILVSIKIAALILFVIAVSPAFDPHHFRPFMPFGFAAHVDRSGASRGVMSAAAVIFFAFYGFDAVSTAAEETQNPGRNLSIGIIGSMLICIVIYTIVAGLAVGALPYTVFARSGEPLAFILKTLGHPRVAAMIAAAAIVALPTVILAFMFGQSRIAFVMARDGLLPRRLGTTDPKTGAPSAMVVVTAAVCAVIAGVLPLSTIAELANAGTLAAFTATSASLIVLRRREPDRHRPFRMPLAFLVAPAAILGCCYLFISLPAGTQIRFFVWMTMGLVVYIGFSRRASTLHLPR